MLDLQQRHGAGVPLITLDLRLASQVCDQLAVMSQGQVVALGPAHQVFGSPQHASIRALFAAALGRGFAFGA